MLLTVAIPTYGRDAVLVESIRYLLDLNERADEILVIDQTAEHNLKTQQQLQEWDIEKKIRWVRIQFPSITRAMNIALRKGRGNRILFLDDDIIPDKDLVAVHRRYAMNDDNRIIAGRVLQPWHKNMPDEVSAPFLFNSLEAKEVSSFMGGNVSIPRKNAIGIGGFDTNFVRVAYHFEAEFAYRWTKNGFKIYYDPKAIIHHLKTERGGTRTFGEHLTTISPDHSVGRYYYNFQTCPIQKAIFKSIQDLVRSITTRHHLRKPIWIPLTIIAELRGFIWAILLWNSGDGRIKGEKINLLVVASHPIQYTTPLYKELTKNPDYKVKVLYLTIPDRRSQSLDFGKEFEWDIPLLEGYDYTCTASECGKGLAFGFMGVKLKRPFSDLSKVTKSFRPDVVLYTGWHFYGMVQVFLRLITGNIPIILRMDSNGMKHRSRLNWWIYKRLISFVKIGLVVGTENQDFCLSLGMKQRQIVLCPHVVDNQFFSERADKARHSSAEIRSRWDIPKASFCFLFAGKFQEKKRPLDLLQALRNVCRVNGQSIYLLMVGTGKLEGECMSYALANNLPVTFVGFLNQTQIPEAYAVSDCIVLPSGDDETWGLVINEAMSCGLPAIVSDKVGCAKDLVHDSQTGYIYRSGEIAELSSVMDHMIRNQELSRQMGQNAKRLIEERYSLNQATKGVYKAVSQIHG
jgi:glycosyltransferase involved in cell wall biosynthesis